ncbi:SDR family oxidoreductase [Mycobacterium avium subsp. paratuberculosis]|uniref:NAD dependent epimerase/dehydratase family protein n=1 Tax=Mycobacterium avium (strain 104) TaxID=243243 RepID=A0A0H2ZY29_MYCA1|nr:NAD dependent epimerase/dehydratase family protein [Mycobacterium avium 104]ETZ47225.1 short chain dehydrogenase family protein [Mycobacterium avium MAV_120809_2495]ETZ50530.1 short chain dehydrogenase family protein [Mycobacterium avium MAV_061107_1842]ETZ68345.1 short chain dehydrogenase family protein [Mycobacterium sp. MAC_080597_8934]KDP04212.1 epimerase [Mycobacterium avium subsp. hominissuis 101]KDP05791.1 epimerase [Mycobacterium avium subsp. hominissuis 100]OUZ03652.1 3 beta-hydro
MTVAVTGPTGEIGRSAVTALEREPGVDAIIGMARRPFSPSSRGWQKTTYQQGDILDREAVDAVVAQADVVIHLAFIIMGSRDESARVNLQGTRNVFEATVAAGRPRRLVYTSSVAAYGYHSDNPVPLTEDVPARGSAEHYYSAQKAASEAMLAEITKDSPLEVFVLRPCIVAGPGATALADAMPWNQLPGPLRAIVKAVQAIPVLKPVVPDPGYPLQLVHHDDVASAIALAATAPAPPGAYNIAGDGVVTVADVAKALGGRPVRVPAVAATAASAAISKAPLVPSMLEWLHTARTSMVMDTTKAKTQLGWRPVHTSAQALAALASAV